MVGYCWGVWLAFKFACECNQIICIAGCHPSLGVEEMFGGNVMDLAKKIQCPVYFMPAENDPDYLKKNGEMVKILEDRFGK